MEPLHCRIHRNTPLDPELADLANPDGRCGWCVKDAQLLAAANAAEGLGRDVLAKLDVLAKDHPDAQMKGAKLTDALEELRTAALRVRHFAGTWVAMLNNARRREAQR